MDLITLKSAESSVDKSSKEGGELLAANSLDLVFQSTLIPSLHFNESKEYGVFALYVCTDSLCFYKIIFDVDKALIDAYKWVNVTYLGISSAPRVYSLLTTTKDESIAVVDDKNTLHIIKLSGGWNVSPRVTVGGIAQNRTKPESSIAAVSSGLVSFIKGVVGKGAATYVPVGVAEVADNLVAVMYSNYELSIWDIQRKTQAAKCVLFGAEAGSIERGKIVIGLPQKSGVVLAAAYCNPSGDWVISTYLITASKTSAVRVFRHSPNSF